MGIRYYRKRLWIKPAFQGRLLLHMGSYFLLYLVIIGVLGLLLFVQEALITKQFKLGVGMYATYLTSLRPLLYASVLLLPYFIYDMIKFSNRVAGPLYRCQAMMREMAEGKPVREFVPRQRDLMPEFFADFNTLIRAWNSKISAEENVPAEENVLAPSAKLEEIPAQHG